MKKILVACIFFFVSSTGEAQLIKDFKVKNSNNAVERTMMLDILRASLYKDYKQEMIFVVNHFKVGNGYAWLKAEAQRKDGKEIKGLGDGDDCCHVEALFKKTGDKWYLAESAAFSTDVWYEGLEEKYPKAPQAIFH